jgi:hypothetical protein
MLSSSSRSEIGVLCPDDPRVAQAVNKLGKIHLQPRRPVHAEAFFRRAVTINEKALGWEAPGSAA